MDLKEQMMRLVNTIWCVLTREETVSSWAQKPDERNECVQATASFFYCSFFSSVGASWTHAAFEAFVVIIP